MLLKLISFQNDIQRLLLIFKLRTNDQTSRCFFEKVRQNMNKIDKRKQNRSFHFFQKKKAGANEADAALENVANGSGEQDEPKTMVESPVEESEPSEGNADDVTNVVLKPTRVQIQNRFAAFQAAPTVSLSKSDKEKSGDIGVRNFLFHKICRL